MHGGGPGDDGGAFGVRRPLRYLAHRLQLDERQTAELARILDEIKTERAQVAVDERRAVSGFADALSGEALDAAKLGEAARRLIHPEALTIVIVGDRKVVEPQLRKLPVGSALEIRDVDGNVVK